MIGNGIRQLCALSLLCGAAMLITPAGAVKKMCQLCCAVVLTLSVLSCFKSVDLMSYGEQLGKYNSLDVELTHKGEEEYDRMNRQVISEKCREYILDKAASLGVEVSGLELTMDWSGDGYWYPVALSAHALSGAEALGELKQIIESDLGIAEDRQTWT